MKKRFFCALLALLLTAAPAMAEGGLIRALATPEPLSAMFESDGLRLTLPAGLVILEGSALEGYEAAAQFDYPEAAHTILAAVDDQCTAALIVAEAESDMDCLLAAQEAAEALIGDPDAASEADYGKNRAAGFACAIGEQSYRLYYLSDGARLLIIGVSGLDEDVIEEMLTELRF